MAGGSGLADGARTACVVRIRTFKNQDYIFATNRLRENVGASELVRRVGTLFVLDAVRGVSGKTIYDDLPEALFRHLLDREINGKIEDGVAAEVVMAASGTALLVVDTPVRGRAMVAAVTERAAREAPGLLVRGAVSEPFRFGAEDERPVHKIIAEVDARLEALAHTLPLPAARFLRLPVVAPCASSGMPAHCIDDQAPAAAYSREILAKRAAREDGWERITRALQSLDGSFRLPKSIEDLDQIEDVDWLAVVHADGNGIGSLMSRLHQYVEAEGAGDARRYIDQLRQFSVALDRCALTAFAQALNALRPAAELGIPVVPLLLGGDDLTVVCDGRQAIRLAERYLGAFERLSARTEGEDGNILARAAYKHSGIARLTCAAGVAVVKPHFPFHAAYDLAEELARAAKSLNANTKVPPVSALDFHVHFDSSGADLGEIRRKYTRPDGDAKATETTLIARPYAATPAEFAQPATGAHSAGAFRHMSALYNAAAKLMLADAEEDDDAKNDDEQQDAFPGHDQGRKKKRLPRTQQHWLRDGLFLGAGAEAAEARLNEIRHRYPDFAWSELLGGCGDRLFVSIERSPGTATNMTRLLDAMDLADLARQPENLGDDPGAATGEPGR